MTSLAATAAAMAAPCLQRHKLNLKATFESTSSHYSFKSYKMAFNRGQPAPPYLVMPQREAAQLRDRTPQLTDHAGEGHLARRLRTGR